MRPLVAVDDLDWIAAVGTLSDLGDHAPWDELPAIKKRYPAKWLKEAVSLVNAARPAGEWQVYDIRYVAPRRDADGKVTRPGSIVAWLNGRKVQDGVTFDLPRSPYVPYRHGVTDHLRGVERTLLETGRGPLFLQDHGSPTRFRNLWFVRR